MDITFTGKITRIGEAYTKETQRGSQITIREITLQTDEAYPQCLALELVNEKALEFAAVEGQEATAHLSFSVTQNPNTGRLWNNVRCWRIDYERRTI